MNRYVIFFALTLLFIAPSTQAQDEALNVEGTWCGKWDGLYKTCFTINRKDQGYQALYEWEEQLGRSLQKKWLKGIRMNDNTINFENKIIVFNLQQKNSATAIGIFEFHSRTTKLTRDTK